MQGGRRKGLGKKRVGLTILRKEKGRTMSGAKKGRTIKSSLEEKPECWHGNRGQGGKEGRSHRDARLANGEKERSVLTRIKRGRGYWCELRGETWRKIPRFRGIA